MKSYKIAYLGPGKTYSYQATITVFDEKTNFFFPCKTLKNVIKKLENKSVDFIVIPYKNTIIGNINETINILNNNNFREVYNVNININHSLLSFYRLENIEYLFSKKEAIQQCSLWIQKNLPKVKIYYCDSTTSGINKATKYLNSASISSEISSYEFNIPIIQKNIQTKTPNITNFLILSNKQIKNKHDYFNL